MKGCVHWTLLLIEKNSTFYLKRGLTGDMARYGLKYCLKGPLSQIQPTNQLTRDH